MFCKTCDYPLWNIAARNCPECGSPFKPADFDFAPESVRFCCPSCGQDYYGTDERGHLVPRDFACVRCNAAIRMDEMVLQPVAGIAERHTVIGLAPWLERKRIGFWRAWLGTIWGAMTAPSRLIGGVPVESSKWSALWFAMLTGFAYMLLAGFPFLILGMIGAIAGASAAGQRGGGGGAMFFGALPMLAFVVLIGFVSIAIGIALWSLLSHIILRITGRTAHGLGRTFQSLCYASSANALSAIPCLGVYTGIVSWIWWAASATLMIRAGQRVSGWRATIAVLLPPVVVSATIIGLFLWMIFWSFGQASQLGSRQGQRLAADISQALQHHAAQHSGALPAHAVEMIAAQQLTPWQISHQSQNPMTVAGIDINSLAFKQPQDQQSDVARILAAMPDDMIAHRLGDVVFTYHGMDVPTAAASNSPLWIALILPQFPQPGVTGSGAHAGNPPPFMGLHLFRAVTADGTAIEIDPANFDTELAAQNSVRATAGLPPLPDLRKIDADHPALAP